MPLVDIHLVKDAWSLEDKQRMIRATEDALIGIWGEAIRPLTWIRVLEVEPGHWSVGGQLFSKAEVDALREKSRQMEAGQG